MATPSPYTNLEMLKAFVSICNAGSIRPNAVLNIYTAPVPPNPVAGATGILLASILLPNPSAAISEDPSQGVVLLTGGTTTVVVADGRAAWWRLTNRDNTTVIDGTIGHMVDGVVLADGDIYMSEIDFTVSSILQPSNIPLNYGCIIR